MDEKDLLSLTPDFVASMIRISGPRLRPDLKLEKLKQFFKMLNTRMRREEVKRNMKGERSVSMSRCRPSVEEGALVEIFKRLITKLEFNFSDIMNSILSRKEFSTIHGEE